MVLVLSEQRRDDLGRAGTEASRSRNNHRALAKVPGTSAKQRREHLAYVAAQLPRLRKLLHELSN